MSKTPNIFRFSNAADFLLAAGEALSPKRGRSLSHAQWAKKLGYRSRRTFGMVLSGKKPASQEIIDRISSVLNLTVSERSYLQLLAKSSRLEKESAHEELGKLKKEMSRLKPFEVDRTLVDSEQFALIAHWYNLVIKQLVAAAGAEMTPEKISSRLRGSIPLDWVKMALSRLERAGILRKSSKNGYEVVNDAITTKADVPAGAVRLHHHEQGVRALHALREAPPAEREFLACTLRFDRENLREAKEFLRKVMNDFDARFSSDKSTDVYQVNIQFFSQTKPEEK